MPVARLGRAVVALCPHQDHKEGLAMDPEESEILQDIHAGISAATIGILRSLASAIVDLTPENELGHLSTKFSKARHDELATSHLGEGGVEAYSQTYDFVESALVEAIEKKTGTR